MSIIKAIILGMVQGLTEFLPISSSGHLLLLEKILKSDFDIGFLLYLHLGTTLALILFFFNLIKEEVKRKNIFLFLKILVALIPIILVGFFFKEKIETPFENFNYLPYFFLISSLLIFFTKYQKEKFFDLNYGQALIIGIFQTLGIFPGISRSGATIAGGLYLGIKNELSFNFAFLLGIPTIIGANIWEFRKQPGLLFSPVYLWGFLASFIFGLLSLYLLKKLVYQKKFYYFGYYLFLIFILLLIDNLKFLDIF
jgi:undecaprenyl-diphosphatase